MQAYAGLRIVTARGTTSKVTGVVPKRSPSNSTSEAGSLSASIRAAYNRELYDPRSSEYGSGSQTAQSAPLYFGIVPTDHTDQVLDNLATICMVRCQDKRLELVFQRDPALPDYLSGDPTRLGQILINLANNAIKFTEQGEIVIKIAALEMSDTQAILQFSVQDSGIGMRRGMRHAHLLGAEEPLMWRLVPALVREMGQAYPELVRAEIGFVKGRNQLPDPHR